MEVRAGYYLGFDGGGTKTDCVLLDASGGLLAQGVAGPSNPLRAGFDEAFQSLTKAAEHVLAAARIDASAVTGVCAGLAGAGRPRVIKRVMGHLVDQFPRAHVHVCTDLEVALEAAVGDGAGVVLVAGTGSAAFGRDSHGRTARAGGHGPWVGDEGSAFDIGRRAVAAVARARDALAPVTLLAEMIPAALECSDWGALLDRITANPDETLPRIFPLVVEAADADDAPAQEILFGAAVSLSALAISVARRLDLADEKFVLAKAGGIFGHSALLDRALSSLIHSAAKRAAIQHLEVAPACGAARLARRLAEREPLRSS
jgi:N-acetylglucosamine kinase-like BadF-type ATPase